MTILAYAFGGSVADEAGRYGMKIGGKMMSFATRKVLSKDIVQKNFIKLGTQTVEATLM